MFRRLRHLAFVLLAGASFIACQKEFTIDGIIQPPVTGPAVFTWEGAPGTCATAVVGGTYAAGTALDSSNRVTIVVNVTTIGTYTVTTDTSNGIKFSGTGAFTALGPQSLVLYGSGTPINAVAAIFSAGANACSFSVTSGAPLPPATYTWEGAPGVCTSATVNGDYFAGTPLDNSNSVTISVNVTTTGTWSVLTTMENGIQFSGLGNFTTTGVQPVTLQGSGTPVDAVPALFSPGANGCSFTVNTSAALPPAVFTWDGAPGACTSATVAGDYIEGTPLDNSNTVTIAVNVSTAGTWTVATATENGIQFSGSGTFATTGAQFITLQGTGTPAAAVSATFTPGTNGCTFPIVTTAGNPATDYLRAKIDGVLKNFSDMAFAEWTSDTLSLGGMVPGSLFEVFAIDIKGTSNLVNGVYEEEGVSPGAPAYVEAGYTTDALDIWYVDINAPTPRTDPFTVTITSISPTRITGTFSGGLWNAAGGTTQLAVTEGEFSLPIQ